MLKIIWKAFAWFVGFHVHDWNNWKQLSTITRDNDDESVVGIIQQRDCKTCGKLQWHSEYL
jgi:hypothetical protein